MTSADGATPQSEFTRLVEEFERCLAEVLGAAARAMTDTAELWAAIVRATIGAEPSGERPAGEGANGAEVRAVLVGVEHRYSVRLAQVERALANTNSDAFEDRVWTFRNRRLASFVKDELAAYLQRQVPKRSVSSVFAAAAQKATRARPPVARGPSVNIMLCNVCGAPRLKEVLYTNCAFCGEPFFAAPAAR